MPLSSEPLGCAATAPKRIAMNAPFAELKILRNPGFESGVATKSWPGWVTAQHAGTGKDYEWSIDETDVANGAASFKIQQIHPQAFGLVQQAVNVAHLTGKELEVAAMMKSHSVGENGWVLSVNVESRREILSQHQSIPIVGTQGWKKTNVRFQLPCDAYEIKVAFILLDVGVGWVDDVEIRVR